MKPYQRQSGEESPQHDPPVQTIAILPDRDSAPVVFDLRPREAGQSSITLDFFQRGECEVGQQGWALTRIGGWANRLISCGAGLFVGSLWSVNDNSALTFANAFYQALLAGDTVAAATQQAHTAARPIGDPTGWPTASMDIPMRRWF